MNNRTKIRGIELGLLLLLAVALAFCTALERQQQEIAGQMIRLHVVAASDSPEDQRIKLQVRDAVLEQAEDILKPAMDRNTAKELLRGNLALLEETANERLRELGSGDTASVTLRRELFGTRQYDSFSLPGGYYDALRVNIGSAAGKNWWCVVYPQICSAATTEQHSVAVMGGLSEEQVAILEGDTPEYRLKFKLLELLEDMLGWFRTPEEGIPVSG